MIQIAPAARRGRECEKRAAKSGAKNRSAAAGQGFDWPREC